MENKTPSANGVKIQKVIERLLQFVDKNKLEITKLKLNRRLGTLYLQLPCDGGDGNSNSSSGGMSQKRRRERRKAQRHLSHSDSSKFSTSSGY